MLSKPARRALLAEKIDSYQKLAACTEGEIAALHGIGPKSYPVMRKALKEAGLAFREAEARNEKKIN